MVIKAYVDISTGLVGLVPLQIAARTSRKITNDDVGRKRKALTDEFDRALDMANGIFRCPSVLRPTKHVPRTWRKPAARK